MPAQSAFEKEWENPVSRTMDRHFSEIAKKYRKLRATDSEPVSVVIDKLANYDYVDAVDVGCGDGRYDLLLYKALGDRLNLTCLDANEEMLDSLSSYLAKNDITHFSAKQSTAESMPFRSESLDCILTFNAIHHFDLVRFLTESARVVRAGGYLFVYTRLRDQNERNIWGQHFPGFAEKETRLFTMELFKESLEQVESFNIESIVFFAYNRFAGLEQLLNRVQSRHYSTFCLYTREELEEAIKVFSLNLQEAFKDTDQIRWFDENVLFIIKKNETAPREAKTSNDYLKAQPFFGSPGMIV